jgi:hypothetical protein
MARYAVTHSCGHGRTVQITGTDVHGERRRKAEWLSTQLCPACARAARETDRQARNAAAAAQAIAAGLPPLEGTPKQAAWAESIRMDLFGQLRARFAGTRYEQRAGEIIAIYMRAASAVTSASEWIDSTDPRELIRDHLTDGDRAALAAIQDSTGSPPPG